jgi:undecaprenyl-diphosphatase
MFAFDQQCALYWKNHGVGWHWNIMVFLTDMGSVATMTMVALMGGVWQFSHGRRFFGSIWFAIVLGGAITNQMLKASAGRDRPDPPLRDRAVLEENESYPSGHAMGSAIGYGMLCYALLRQTRFPLRRTVIAVFFAVLVAGIGFSRIYLRAHWFSDVIGGWALGLCWLFLWLGWLESRRRIRHGELGHIIHGA